MNCHEARLHWDMYYDSEGDPEVHLQLNEHLSQCAGCRSWFDQQSRLESLIEQRLVVDGEGRTVPKIDWTRVLACAVDKPSTSVFRPLLSIGAPLLAVAATILLLAWLTAGFGTSEAPPSLSKLSAELHRHVSAGSLRPEFESDSDLEVERFFSKRVPFPVRCPPRQDSGFAVKGAGRCELANQQAAFVFGNVDQQPVSIFVLPVESLAAFPQQSAQLQGDLMQTSKEGNNGLVFKIIDRNVVLVVGSVALEKLTRVLQSYGTYPHTS